MASQVGQGSCFSFRIPVEEACEADQVPEGARRQVTGLEPGQPEIRLLVVEDSERSRVLLVRLLEAVGFEAREAPDGRSALEIWKEWRPHLIWMDMRMPVMDGYEATSRIKSTPGGEETVVIALTAGAFEDDHARTLEHGCDDFVRKPFREHEIFDKIERHLGVRYLYRDEGQEIDRTDVHSSPANAPSLDELPDPVVAELMKATQLADTVAIDGAIEEIRRLDPRMGKILSDLAGEFAYGRILELTGEEDSGDIDSPSP